MSLRGSIMTRYSLPKKPVSRGRLRDLEAVNLDIGERVGFLEMNRI
jgi:hypothetical protein